MSDRHPALVALDNADHTIRTAAMLDLYHLPDIMPRHEWFTRFGQMWGRAAHLSKHHSRYAGIIGSATRAELDAMMTPEERAALNSMPSPLLVFRGCNQFTQRGLSWTTRLGVATTFASIAVHFADRGITPLILTGYVNKNRAVYKNHGLSEVIATNVIVVSTDRYTGAAYRMAGGPSDG